MSSDRNGRLVVLSGPTACGKSTIWRRLVAHPQISFSVSATTRSPRGGEIDGRDYRFVSAGEFSHLIEQGAFLEWAEVHGNRYGTLRSDVKGKVDGGLDVLLEIDVQGARQLSDCGIPSLSIFITPPSLDELRKRLEERGTEGKEERERRLAIVEEELSQAESYDHVIVNDDLDRALSEIESILGLEPVS